LGNFGSGKGHQLPHCIDQEGMKKNLEFRKEGEVMLLVGRRDGGQQQFVVSKKGERTTFKEKAEIFDRMASSEELSVEGGIMGFCGRNQGIARIQEIFAGGELLTGIRSISGQGEGQLRSKTILRLEGKGHFRSPSEETFAAVKGARTWAMLVRKRC
jgi:hypothetical protein